MPIISLPHRSSSLLYARGCVLSSNQIAPPIRKWKTVALPELYCCHDPRTRVTLIQHSHKWVAIIGEILDVRAPENSAEIIASELAEKLESSEHEFHEHCDYLSGRYVIIYYSNSTKIIGDAACTRALFYHTTHPFTASSHATLLAKITDSDKNDLDEQLSNFEPWRRPRPARSYPGDLTPFANIKLLTPNVSLNVKTLKLDRVWPREHRQERSGESVALECIDWMRSHILWAAIRKRPIAISLSAGLDSRTTLAVAKDHLRHVHCFTHKSNHPTALRDEEIASKIAKSYRLHHRVIDTERAYPRKYDVIFDQNHYSTHLRSAAIQYLRKFSQKTIHLRTNLPGIVCSYFRAANVTYPEKGTPRALARAWRHMQKSRLAVEIFDEWARNTGLLEVDTFGYHYMDLFYWEHRIPAWYSCSLLETDVAFDTWSIFNSRIILISMLAVPFEDRVERNVQRKMIPLMWPELTRYPVNGKHLW